MSYVAVYVTTKDAKEARKISRILLDKRLVACTNIIPSVESNYNWEGKRVSHKESLIVAKTKGTLKEDIIKTVRANHSYTVPCINFIPIVKGNPDYLKWIDKETRK